MARLFSQCSTPSLMMGTFYNRHALWALPSLLKNIAGMHGRIASHGPPEDGISS